VTEGYVHRFPHEQGAGFHSGRLAEKIYEKRVTVSRTRMAEVNKHVQHAAGIPKYLVTISPPLRSV